MSPRAAPTSGSGQARQRLAHIFAKPTKIPAMNIVLNGESRTIDSPSTVADLLAALGYADKRVAVERNGEIVPRSTHASTPLADGDELEIVVAVGGG